MSDDVFSVRTPFTDVAEMAQGYVQRADGERLWLPLSSDVGVGGAVRFIVHLADGTPAYAGAGRAIQVADQGEGALAEHRFETLLDSLQFDERSQPVYDYIVAVRASVLGAQLEDGSGEPTDDAADAGMDAEIAVSDPPPDAEMFGDEEATEYIGRPDPASEVPAAPSVTPPAPIPTGMLTRPAIATHWQPAAPVPPRPSQGSGLFRYNGGGLPVPARPPWPEIDPSLFVRPAPRPMSAEARAALAGQAPAGEAFPREESTADADYDGSTSEIAVGDFDTGVPGEALQDAEAIEASASTSSDDAGAESDPWDEAADDAGSAGDGPDDVEDEFDDAESDDFESDDFDVPEDDDR